MQFYSYTNHKSDISFPSFVCCGFSSCRVPSSPNFSNGWMNTWMSGGGQEEALQALNGGDRGHPCVCRYAVWTLVTRKSTKMIETHGTNTLLAGTGWYCFSGVAGGGEVGETTHRCRPFFTHIHLPIDSEAQLAKNKVHNGLNFSYYVVHTWD